MEFNTLTLTLRNFVNAFQGGYERIAPAAHSLLGILCVIDLALFAAWWALDGGHQLSSAFKKLLSMGIWIWICLQFPTLAKAFVDSLVKAGLTAGGNSSGAELLLDPSRIAGYGLDVSLPLAEKLEDMSAIDGSDVVVFGLGYIAIMLSFFVVAMQVFLAVLEYYMLAALVGILLPFGLLPATKFLAEKAVGAIVASGIKLMTLAFVLAVAEPVIREVHFAREEIGLNELWSVFLTTASLGLLCWKAPNMASGLLAGSPTLSFSEVGRSAAGTVSSTLATAGAALAAVGGGAINAIRSASSSAPSAAPAPPAASSAAAPVRADASTLSKSASHQGDPAPSPAAAPSLQPQALSPPSGGAGPMPPRFY